MGLRLFMLNLKRFASKSEKKIVLDYFRGFEVGLRFFCPGRAKC